MAAARNMITGKYICFDKGGVPRRSQYNTDRQYDSSKRDEYQIDFFILANVSGGHNFIYHLMYIKAKTSITYQLH